MPPGEKIALASVGARNNRLLEGIRKTKRVEAMVDELIEEVMAYDGEGRDPGEKVAAAARRMLMAQAVEAVSQMGKDSFEGLTPEKLAQMVNALERSRISAERPEAPVRGWVRRRQDGDRKRGARIAPRLPRSDGKSVRTHRRGGQDA